MRKNIGGSHGTAFLLCCLLFVSVVYAEADSGTPLSEARALHLLEAQIQRDGLYQMDKTPAGWRIADIRYQKGLPLSELLKQ